LESGLTKTKFLRTPADTEALGKGTALAKTAFLAALEAAAWVNPGKGAGEGAARGVGAVLPVRVSFAACRTSAAMRSIAIVLQKWTRPYLGGHLGVSELRIIWRHFWTLPDAHLPSPAINAGSP
jgi:hypothetical protein